MVIEDPNYSPGPRVKSSMVAIQAFPNPALNDTRDEHYIYIFGGIKIRSIQDINKMIEIKPELVNETFSSFEYMGDLWRFNMLSA